LHIIPDLVRLENKYPGVLVVIGVHSPKFPHEKNTASIRKAMLRYGVTHPVINDANLVLWKRFEVNFWPTFVLIDPDGRFYGKVNGEGLYKALDLHIGKLVKAYKAKGRLKETPLRFALEKEKIKGPLFFPGKVLADNLTDRLFIADSTNNRIVITDLQGNGIAVAGSGKEGKKDGSFAEATFAEPQGMAWDGKLLYVADRKNHLIRSLDLKAKTVKTIAGVGYQERKIKSGPALLTGLNSPWDLLYMQNRLFIAMAGHHQIWIMDMVSRRIGPFAGDGDENLMDGPPSRAKFAQPSGLGTDGRELFIADSETSAIRAVPLSGRGMVRTIVGAGLFEFGDTNGQGKQVRLQHALAAIHHQGKLYVADTYNSKIKLIDPVQGTCTTFLGDAEGTFDEPSGLSIAAGKMYVADTNAHRIRVIDLESKDITTVELKGVNPPTTQAARSK